ncbi:MAG TPA: acyl-CoA dehydrogenase family protein [Actinophytocola sp.]|uniref:acyl-CoA dehydrogenase family protein n=1 Tax=Actinophytocola sp. TaxID=1872138 RepID=UPI002DB8B6E2|nr:acyl-CoA dehydrogenase family protein [Actinophytocola sp.]HEU5473464.1 acyl-CoA dehydrogenase family protein [Actinophytocola sp.]
MAVSEEQVALRNGLRSLLSREPDHTLWTRLCEMGVAGLTIPEDYGGLGASRTDLHVVMAELGQALRPVPLLGSAVLAAQAVLATGDEPACRELLPGVAAGDTIAALAWTGPDGRWDPETVACTAGPLSNVDWSVTGEAHYVLDGAAAGVLLVAARTGDGLGLFQVDPGQPTVHRAATPTMDESRNLATVRFAGARARRLGPAVLSPVRDLACVALAAEQAGAARRCLELTVAYTRTRVQFGRPIGSFQAIKHRLADLHVLVETAESAALAAAATPAADLPLAAAVAKIHCAEALGTVAAEMIQLHGGIAITWEHDAHRYFKRAHGSAQLFGAPAEHVARLSRSLTG